MMKKLFLYLAILLASPVTLIAQSNLYVVGTPSGTNTGTGYPCPFANWYWGTRQQYLITSAELQAAGASSGDLTEIAFNVLNLNSVPALQNYQVWIKTTSNTPSLTAWETNMGSPVIGPITYTVTTGWNTFSFPKMFWNGSDNIVIEICSNNSGFIGNGNAAVEWATGLPFNASRTYRADNATNCGNAASSNILPNNRPIIRFRIEPPFANNAGATNLDKPGAALCDASTDVAVSFRNTGEKDLTSVTLGWTVIRNGNQFPINYYNWSGQLSPSSEAKNIQVGNFSPGFQNQDILKFWTEMPNGVPDSLATEDTMRVTIRDGISGTYNVGGFFNIDFATMNEAEQLVDSFRAVCDSLVFNIRDGIYYGQLDFLEVFNSDPTRPIIFRAENGVNSNVIIIDSTNSASNNFITKLVGAKDFYFENIKFQNTSPNNGRVIVIDSLSQNINFIGCEFLNNYSGTNPSNEQSLVYSPQGSYDSNLNFENCTFQGGSYGLHLEGRNRDTTLTNISVTNCTFNNQLAGGISIVNCENLTISGNDFQSNKFFVGSEAISVLNNNNFLSIDNNSILSNSSWPFTGVHVQNSDGIPANQGYVFNNFIKVGDSALTNDFKGIKADTCKFFNAVNNSVLVLGSSNNSVGVSFIGGGANSFMNNSISNAAGGPAILVEDVTGFPLAQSDHNNFYTSGQNIGNVKNAGIGSLAQWAATIGDDANSISVSPGYISPLDLHVCGGSLDNKGAPISWLQYDIDGQTRNSTTPDIGADEFQPITNLNIGKDTTVCKGTSISLLGALNYNDFYTAWSTGDTASMITVNDPGTYSVISSNICGIAYDTIVVSLSQSAELGSDTNICADASIVLDAKVTNGSYHWNTGENTQTVTINESGIYTVSVTDMANCITIDTIFITQSLKANLPNDTSVCGGQAIFLDPGTGQGVYSWSNGATTPSILATISDTISVSYTDLFGCSSADTMVFVSTTIPDAEFTSSTFPGSPATIAFTSNSYPNTSYFWNFGDGDTSSLQNPTHLFPSDGVYLTTLQLSNPCGADFFSQEFEVSTSTEELRPSAHVSIFPNPASEILKINFSNKPENLNLIITDINGKEVRSINIVNSNFVELDVSNLSSGSYFINGSVDSNLIEENFIVK